MWHDFSLKLGIIKTNYKYFLNEKSQGKYTCALVVQKLEKDIMEFLCDLYSEVKLVSFGLFIRFSKTRDSFLIFVTSSA